MSKPAPTPQQQAAEAIEGLQFEMRGCVRSLFADHGLAPLMQTLTDGAYSNLLKNVGLSNLPNAVAPTTTYPLTQQALEQLNTALSLVGFVAQLYEQQTTIESLEKEVGDE